MCEPVCECVNHQTIWVYKVFVLDTTSEPQMLHLNALGEYLEWLSMPPSGNQVVTLTPHESNCKCMRYADSCNFECEVADVVASGMTQ